MTPTCTCWERLWITIGDVPVVAYLWVMIRIGIADVDVVRGRLNMSISYANVTFRHVGLSVCRSV
jgi:hypothetical protein